MGDITPNPTQKNNKITKKTTTKMVGYGTTLTTDSRGCDPNTLNDEPDCEFLPGVQHNTIACCPTRVVYSSNVLLSFLCKDRKTGVTYPRYNARSIEKQTRLNKKICVITKPAITYTLQHKAVRTLFNGKEGNVLFNDALNTFYLRLYGVSYLMRRVNTIYKFVYCIILSH